jgi:hypothetical protein
MRHLARIASFVIICVLSAISASSQEITAANLPAETTLAIFSHNNAQIRAAVPANPMVQAWYSPQSAMARKLLVQYVVSQMASKPGGKNFTLSAENIDRLLSVLENSLVFGVTGSLDYMTLAQAPSNPASKMFEMSGLFLILDISGKEAQFKQVWPAIEAALPKEIARSHYDFGGTSVEKFAGPSNTTFTAQTGSRFVWANQQKVIEQLVLRLRSGETPGSSLAENPDFQHCRAQSAPGQIVDVFLRFPDLSKVPIPASAQFDAAASVKSLHLDSLHAVCGSYSMTQDGELGRWLILGDTSQGSLLSWFGSNRANFETLALVPPSASSFTVGSFDLQAFYKSFKSALGAGMPGRQQASADLMEEMLTMQLGMPLADILGVFRGEFASIKTASQSSNSPGIFAMTVSNPERILDLIHKLAPSAISGETQEDGVTYFKTGAQIPSVGAAQTPATDTYIALTPKLLVVSADKQVLRDFVARAGSSQSANGGMLTGNPEVLRIRTMMPAEVLGFSVTDYTKEDFQKQIMDAFSKSGQQSDAKLSPEETQLMEGLKRIPWATFIGGIHWGVSAWWKDADGIHFESRVQ